MNVADNAQQLGAFLQEAADVSQDKPVVITKFIVNAKEIEFDAVAKEVGGPPRSQARLTSASSRNSQEVPVWCACRPPHDCRARF